MREATLIAARMLSPSVRELTFDAGPEFRFAPGQWVSFRIPSAPGEEISRAYSIASPPRPDGRFEIAVTRVESGAGSEFLHAAMPGTTLRMSHAQGFFTLNPVVRPVLMVGTGTGVAPLRAMLGAVSMEPEDETPFVLLFGVRDVPDVLYASDFGDLASRWKQFRFVPSLSRAPAEWTGRRGYVQTHVAQLVRELGGDCDVYVCGLNRMIKEVRRVLKEDLGYARDRIHTERYD